MMRVANLNQLGGYALNQDSGVFGELLTEGYTDGAEDAVKPSWWTSPLTNYPKKSISVLLIHINTY